MTIFVEYVRARDPDVEWTRGLGSHAPEWTAPFSSTHSPPSFLVRSSVSFPRTVAAANGSGVEEKPRATSVILACHVCSTMRVPTVEWPVYNPAMARLGPPSLCVLSFILSGGERGEKLEEGRDG